MPTKIIWPNGDRDDIELTEHPDGTLRAEYLDSYNDMKTVVINPDGSRDQTVTNSRGTELVRYEIDADGVLFMRKVNPDGSVYTIAVHPGRVVHVSSRLEPDGTFHERTYYADNWLEKTVDREGFGSTVTIITNLDGIRRVTVD